MSNIDQGSIVAAGGATTFLAGLSVLPIEPVTGLSLAASGLGVMLSSSKVKRRAEREAYSHEMSAIRERTSAMEKEVDFYRTRMQQVQTTLLWSALTCGASIAYFMWSRSTRRASPAPQDVAAAAPQDPQEEVVQGIVVNPDLPTHDPVATLRLQLQDFHRSDGEMVEASESRDRAGIMCEQQLRWQEMMRFLH